METKMRSKSLKEPGDQFEWSLQVCTFGCNRAMVYAGKFGVGPDDYNTSICIICQKRRRGRQRPHWYINNSNDLPQIGERLADWEARKRANPGVFE